jgi:hypothetical protein
LVSRLKSLNPDNTSSLCWIIILGISIILSAKSPTIDSYTASTSFIASAANKDCWGSLYILRFIFSIAISLISGLVSSFTFFASLFSSGRVSRIVFLSSRLIHAFLFSSGSIISSMRALASSSFSSILESEVITSFLWISSSGSISMIFSFFIIDPGSFARSMIS